MTNLWKIIAVSHVLGVGHVHNKKSPKWGIFYLAVGKSILTGVIVSRFIVSSG